MSQDEQTEDFRENFVVLEKIRIIEIGQVQKLYTHFSQ